MNGKVLTTLLVLVTPAVCLSVCRFVRLCYARIRNGDGGLFQEKLPPGIIRHSVDTLPMGMMFCHTNGHVLLKNRKMDELCEALTGHVLINGRAYMEELLTRDFGDGVLVRGTPDLFSVITGRSVYSFRRETLSVNGRTVIQLTAYDTMELFAREKELKARLAELEEKGKQIKDATERAEYLAMNEERLSTKARIHDMVGQVLLSARYVLTESDAQMTPGRVLAQIRQAMDELLESGREGHRDVVRTDAVKKSLTDAAQAMGLLLSFEGEIPDESTRVMRMLTGGARVCMTNAVRHGLAKKMVITFETDENACTKIRFCNDGKPPPVDTAEGGGLQSLRTQLQTMGGNLYYEFDASEMPAGSRFGVVLEIPWGGMET